MRIDIKGVIVNNDDAEVYQWLGLEYTCPKDVEDAIAQAKKDEPIDVRINSGGGDLFAGSEIYSTLKSEKRLNRILVSGLAASAASVILCAGYSEIEPTAMVMIHNVWSMAMGDYRAMEHEAEILKKANDAIAAAYQMKTGKDPNELKALMDHETYLTAAEAVELGICDKVRDAPRKLAAAVCPLLSQEVIDKTREKIRAEKQREAQNELEKIKKGEK